MINTGLGDGVKVVDGGSRSDGLYSLCFYIQFFVFCLKSPGALILGLACGSERPYCLTIFFRFTMRWMEEKGVFFLGRRP